MAVFGCDIGNGYACVSLVDDTQGKPRRAFPPEVARAGLPTTSYVDHQGKVLVDETDVQQGEKTDPGRVVRTIKRHLDEPAIQLMSPDGKHVEDTIKPADVYSQIAAFALDTAFKESRDSRQVIAHDLVLTYPAHFATAPILIDRMSESIEILAAPDGLPYKVVGRIPEPAAVALDFLAFMRHEVRENLRLDARNLTVVVYDLGHGTFDTSLVTAKGTVEESGEEPWVLHDHAGIKDLGGVDFDERIVRILEDKADLVALNQRSSVLTRQSIHHEAVRCKHTLTNMSACNVTFGLDDGTPVSCTISREEFEDASSDLIEETWDCVERMFATADAKGLKVTHLVLSGGSSQMPMVHRMLEEAYGERLEVVSHRPSEAVSFGAARYGAQVESREPVSHAASKKPAGVETTPKRPSVRRKPKLVGELKQLAHRDVGVLIPDTSGKRSLMVLVPQNSELPYKSEALSIEASGVEILVTVGQSRNRRAEGTIHQSERIYDYIELGRVRSDGFSPGTNYELKLELSDNGSFSCTITDRDGTTTKLDWA